MIKSFTSRTKNFLLKTKTQIMCKISTNSIIFSKWLRKWFLISKCHSTNKATKTSTSHCFQINKDAEKSLSLIKSVSCKEKMLWSTAKESFFPSTSIFINWCSFRLLKLFSCVVLSLKRLTAWSYVNRCKIS